MPKVEPTFLGQSREKLLASLLQLSGDNRVAPLIDLATVAQPGARPIYFKALGELVSRGDWPPSSVSSNSSFFSFGWSFHQSPIDEIDPVLPSEVGQARVLDFLSAAATANISIDEAEELNRIFAAKRREQTLPALRRLIDHPSSSVAEAAALTLTAAGQSVTVPPKLGPARYQVMLNGVPASELQIEWTVFRDTKSISSNSKTSVEGILEIERDHFFADETSSVQSVRLASVNPDSPADGWFEVSHPPPPATETIQPINIPTTTARISLAIPLSDHELSDRVIEVQLGAKKDPSDTSDRYRSPARLKLPATRSLTFSKISPGTYLVTLRLPGTATWTGEIIASTDGDVSAITLNRASDVSIAINPPAPWTESLIFPELLQNGEQVPTNWDYATRTFLGVVPGHYTVRIPSSTEVRGRLFETIPDAPDFESRTVTFDIAENSPTQVAIGPIPIPAAGEPLNPQY